MPSFMSLQRRCKEKKSTKVSAPGTGRYGRTCLCSTDGVGRELPRVVAREPGMPSGNALRLGNFGGRAAGQGAPGQNDQLGGPVIAT